MTHAHIDDSDQLENLEGLLEVPVVWIYEETGHKKSDQTSRVCNVAFNT